MGINHLIKISESKKLSEYAAKELISSFAPYETAVIDLSAVTFFNDFIGETPPHVEISDDVKLLRRLIDVNQRIMLPCTKCRQEQPYKLKQWINLNNVETVVKSDYNSRTVGKMIFINPNYQSETTRNNIFDSVKPSFHLSSDLLCDITDSDKQLLSNDRNMKLFLQNCVNECKKVLLKDLSTIWLNYSCGYDSDHAVFAIFRLFDPIEHDDTEEYNTLIQRKKGKTNDAVKAYEALQNCLVLQKIGQFPSLFDMDMWEGGKYYKVLDQERYADLRMAIRLNANRIGCGSFLYLRRILESLILDVGNECGIDSAKLKQVKVKERINLVEAAGGTIIPNELNQVKELIYGVLSKGVHECSEQECIDMFPWVRYCIEKMLDERIKQKEATANTKKVNAMFNQFNTKHNTKN